MSIEPQGTRGDQHKQPTTPTPTPLVRRAFGPNLVRHESPRHTRVIVAVTFGAIALGAVGAVLVQLLDLTVSSPAPVLTTVPTDQSTSASAQASEEGQHYTGLFMHDLAGQQVNASEFPTDRTDGVFVRNVFIKGPAFQAGIRPGDVYIALDGVPVRRGVDIVAKNRFTPVGQRYTVTLERDGAIRNVSVQIAEATAEYRAWVISQKSAGAQ